MIYNDCFSLYVLVFCTSMFLLVSSTNVCHDVELSLVLSKSDEVYTLSSRCGLALLPS